MARMHNPPHPGEPGTQLMSLSSVACAVAICAFSASTYPALGKVSRAIP